MANDKPIKQSVINTFKRVELPYEILLERNDERITVNNIFGYGSAVTTPLVAACILWVYRTNLEYEQGIRKVTTADFDRLRYFVLAQDREAYMTCLD